jgi:DNA-binding CsgD family transcriptional regulator
VKVHNERGNPWIVIIRPVLNSYGPFGNVEQELHVEIHNGVPRAGSLDLFQSLFSLTAREVQVVRFLADGHCVDSLSNCLEISPNTARTHLRSIFTKTSTTRQSELLQLCTGLSPAEA